MPDKKPLNNIPMFKNYFKIAFRNLIRNKLFSVINIFGLAIGISASLVIFLIVQYDFSFDKFEKNHDRIYRVVTENDARVPDVLVNTVKNETSGLDVVAPFMLWDSYDLKVTIPQKDNAKVSVFKNEQNVIYADQDYFKLINYKWLAGSPETSLSAPSQTVLTEQNAKRFFPNLSLDDIIGKEVVFNDTIRTNVSGIVQNLKSNSDFQFQTFVSSATLPVSNRNHFFVWQLFIKLSKNSTPFQIKNQIAKSFAVVSKSLPNRFDHVQFNLQPLSNLHFSTVYNNFDQRKAHLPTLYGLMAVAGILLLLACINFINLTTAQSSQRAKEIGIRKTLGGSRKQLIFQFLSETFLLTLVATLISIILTPFLLKL